MGTKISITDIRTNTKYCIDKDKIDSLKFDDYSDTLEIFLNGIDKPITVYDKDKVLFDKIFGLFTENANVIDIP